MIGIVTAAMSTSLADACGTATSGGVAKTLAAATPAVIAPATTAVRYALDAPMTRTVNDECVIRVGTTEFAERSQNAPDRRSVRRIGASSVA